MSNLTLKPSWDIFCKIIDNFGDIGVCWRLARQLELEHGLQVRLWIDDLNAAQAIISGLNIEKNQQVCEEISILKWPIADKEVEADFSKAAEVVIEAFASGLPPAYLVAMAQRQSKWINLEYLSAEQWVADFHAKPSPQFFLNSANSLTRYFYFPGFTEATGGLIRERDIAAQLKNHTVTSFPRKQESILTKNPSWIPALRASATQIACIEHFAEMTECEVSGDVLKVSLFCYPHAPIHDLLKAMAGSNQVVNCYIPASSILPQLADFFNQDTIDIGDYFTRDNLHVQILPFLSQANYDVLLRNCDINFVRGEDSWVRAIWAGKPFIWQPYFQAENTHLNF